MIYKINTSVNLKDSNMRKKRNLIALAMISNPLFRNKVEKSTFEKTVKQDQCGIVKPNIKKTVFYQMTVFFLA